MKLREIRKSRGLTQVELAERTGLDQSMSSKIERNVMVPSFRTIVRLARVLGVRLDDLIDEDIVHDDVA